MASPNDFPRTKLKSGVCVTQFIGPELTLFDQQRGYASFAVGLVNLHVVRSLKSHDGRTKSIPKQILILEFISCEILHFSVTNLPTDFKMCKFVKCGHYKDSCVVLMVKKKKKKQV